MTPFRRLLAPALLAFVSFAGAGCGSDLVATVPTFRVRLLNAAPGSPRCYLSMNGAVAGDTLPFPAAGRYVALTNFNQQIRILSEAGSVVATTGPTPVAFAPGQDNTIFLVGNPGFGYKLLTSIDNRHSGIPAGEVDLRVYHLVPNIQADVRLILDGALYGDLSQVVVDAPYNPVVAGAHTFKFVSVSDTGLVYVSRTVNLPGGQRCTVALTGLRGDTPPLDVTVVVDSAVAAAPGMTSQTVSAHNLLK